MSEADQPKRRLMLPRWFGFTPQDKQTDPVPSSPEPRASEETWTNSLKSENPNPKSSESVGSRRSNRLPSDIEQILPPKLDLTNQGSNQFLDLINFGSEFPDLPESLAKLVEQDQDVSELVSTVQQRYGTMHDRMVELDETLKQHQKSLALLQARSQNQEALLSQQSHELGVSHQHAARLMAELESANETAQRQQALVESLAHQLETAQNRINQFEAAQAQVQSGEELQAQRVAALEATCAELRSRLQRQQRYTLQFKAALEKCLEQPSRREIEIESLNLPTEARLHEADIDLTPQTLPTHSGLTQESRPFLFGDDEVRLTTTTGSSDALAAESWVELQIDEGVDGELIFSETVTKPALSAETVDETKGSILEDSCDGNFQVEPSAQNIEQTGSSASAETDCLDPSDGNDPFLVFTSGSSADLDTSSKPEGNNSVSGELRPDHLELDLSNVQLEPEVGDANPADLLQSSAVTADFLFDRLGIETDAEQEEDLWANLAQIIEAPSGVPTIDSFIPQVQDLDMSAFAAGQAQRDTWLQTNPLLPQDTIDIPAGIKPEGSDPIVFQEQTRPRFEILESKTPSVAPGTPLIQPEGQIDEERSTPVGDDSFALLDDLAQEASGSEPAFTIQDGWPSPTILPRQVEATSKKRNSLASVKLPSFPKLSQW